MKGHFPTRRDSSLARPRSPGSRSVYCYVAFMHEPFGILLSRAHGGHGGRPGPRKGIRARFRTFRLARAKVDGDAAKQQNEERRRRRKRRWGYWAKAEIDGHGFCSAVLPGARAAPRKPEIAVFLVFLITRSLPENVSPECLIRSPGLVFRPFSSSATHSLSVIRKSKISE